MHDAPEPSQVTDVATLKALAHPRRQRIRAHLIQHGPATSAMVARALNLNTGATSYHLRELARTGLVEEAESDGHGRERWWRAPSQDLRFPRRSAQDPAMRAAMDELARTGFEQALEEFHRAQEAADPGDPWSDAFPFSLGSVTVTLEELEAFFEDYIALLKRYQREPGEAPEGRRTVIARFFAYPAPPPPGADDPPEAEA